MSTNRKKFFLPMAMAAAGLATGIPLATSALASPVQKAATTTVYATTLGQVNNSGASGTVSISLTGSTATITEHVTGLGATFGGNPYPHVQHIHIDGQGACPTAAADTSGDGVISTTEGGPAYGKIGTTLSTQGDTTPAAALTLNVAPTGGSFDYSRTFDLDPATLASLQAGKAVVVVHGLDNSKLPAAAQNEKSELVPSLPLAATSPALCGVLAAQAAPAPTTTTVPATNPPAVTSPPVMMAPATPMAASPKFTG